VVERRKFRRGCRNKRVSPDQEIPHPGVVLQPPSRGLSWSLRSTEARFILRSKVIFRETSEATFVAPRPGLMEVISGGFNEQAVNQEPSRRKRLRTQPFFKPANKGHPGQVSG
jgi:hypothetical protein